MSDLLNQASLVYIPSGYKEDTAYSVIPTDGSGDLTFSRASDGTRVNSQGLVERVPWNLWTESNNFSATYWDQYQLTPTTGTTSDIYGNSSTVYKLIGNVTNSYCFINRSSNGSANTAFSVYAKPNGYTKIGISNRSGNPWNFVVDLVTKVVSNIYDSASSIVSINVIDAVGDWKRIEVVVSSAIQYNLHPLPSNFNSTNFDNVTLNGTDGVWVMGAQVNEGSTAKPYFPTTDRLNVPRLDYSGGCPSLLLEPQRTNYFEYSEDYSQIDWSKTSLTVVSNAATSPDGYQNADKIYPSATGGISYLYNISFTSSSVHTISAYVKADGKNIVWLYIEGGVTYGVVYFDLSDQSIQVVGGSVSTPSGTITAVGNDWYRITFTTGSALAVVSGSGIGLSDAKGSSYITANGTNGVLVWGLQLEAGSYPTSYIPTTSASVTRVADACYKTGISSLIGQTEGVMFVDLNFTHNNSGSNEYLAQIRQDSTNRILLYRSSSGAVIGVVVLKAGTQIFSHVSSVSSNSRHKVAIAYKSGDLAFYIDGVQIATNSTTFSAYSSLSVFDLGSNTTGGSPVELGDYNYNQAILFPTRLTNAELASLTTI